MIRNDSRRIRDHEYRTRTGLWRGCRKIASVRVESIAVQHLELDYCAKHALNYRKENSKDLTP